MADADDALKAAQGMLYEVLHDDPPCDAAWYIKAWHPIAARSLRRLIAYANSALALRYFFANKPDDSTVDLPERTPFNAWRVVQAPRPGTLELTLEPLRFRLHLAPGVEAPARLTAAQVVRAEWRYTPPKVRFYPKRGPRKPRPIETPAPEATT